MQAVAARIQGLEHMVGTLTQQLQTAQAAAASGTSMGARQREREPQRLRERTAKGSEGTYMTTYGSLLYATVVYCELLKCTISYYMFIAIYRKLL